MTRNKLLIALLFLLLLLIIAGFFIPDLAGISTVLFILVGLHLMLINGSFIRTKLYRFVMLGLSILFAGIVFKIMHLPGADYLIIVGLISVGALYTVHFWQKPVKDFIDYGKLLFILGELTLRIVGFTHLYSISDELRDAWDMIVVIFILYYVFRNHLVEIRKSA